MVDIHQTVKSYPTPNSQDRACVNASSEPTFLGLGLDPSHVKLL